MIEEEERVCIWCGETENAVFHFPCYLKGKERGRSSIWAPATEREKREALKEAGMEWGPDRADKLSAGGWAIMSENKKRADIPMSATYRYGAIA